MDYFSLNYFKKYFFVILPIFFSGVLIINAFSNNGGLQEFFLLKKKIEYSQENLVFLRKDADKLQYKIDLISGNIIDQDLLEELAQKNLGYIYSNEVILSFDN